MRYNVKIWNNPVIGNGADMGCALFSFSWVLITSNKWERNISDYTTEAGQFVLIGKINPAVPQPVCHVIWSSVTTNEKHCQRCYDTPVSSEGLRKKWRAEEGNGKMNRNGWGARARMCALSAARFSPLVIEEFVTSSNTRLEISVRMRERLRTTQGEGALSKFLVCQESLEDDMVHKAYQFVQTKCGFIYCVNTQVTTRYTSSDGALKLTHRTVSHCSSAQKVSCSGRTKPKHWSQCLLQSKELIYF